MSFEWQTTEEGSEEPWQQEPTQEATGSPFQRQRWLVLLLTLALAVIAAIFLYREGRQRVEESTARLEADVLSSHQLGHTALDGEDLELFSAILSGRLPAWTEAQKERFQAGLVYEQTAQVLGLEPLQGSAETSDVSFDSELREATVSTPWRYRLSDGSVTETVTLTQTAVYRKGTERWLLSPPQSPEFWGNWRTREREFVAVTYPVRDEGVALKLARDLDRKVAEMCNRVVCPDGYAVSVRLEREPQSLLSLPDPEQRLIGRQAVVLPTPTLVGLPVGEAAYEALFKGYARYLLTALLVDLHGWNCCRHVLFQQVLLYRQLAALEVAPVPVNELDYLLLPDNIPDRQQLLRWWRENDPVAGPDEIPLAVYAFLDFVRTVADFEGDSFSFQPLMEPVLENWLEDTESFSQFDWEAEWPDFVRRQVMRAQAESPMPPGLTPPAQELVAVCTDQDSDGDRDDALSVLVRYDPVSETWLQPVELGSGFFFLASLLGDDGYFLTRQHPFQESEPLRMDTYLHRVGRPPLLVSGGEGSDVGMLPFPWRRPGGEEMLAWTFAPGEEGLETAYALVIPDTCSADGCRLEELPGPPVWSPDGQQVLAISFDNAQIILRRTSENEWVEVGSGSFPFWLDNETYAYVEQHQQGVSGGVWLSRVGEDRPERWLPEEMLEELLPEGRSRYSFGLVFGSAHPLVSNEFLLVGTTNQGAELFAVGREPEAAGWLESVPRARYIAALPQQATRSTLIDEIVGQGRRWLALPISWEGAGLWLYDLAEEETLLTIRQGPGTSLQSFDWSADDAWLARPAEGALDLIAPGFKVDGRPYRRLVFHEFGVCSSVAWQDRN